MSKGSFDSLWLTSPDGEATLSTSRSVPAAQYKSANVIETSNSLLPSQRRMERLDTASPLAQPVTWGVIFSLIILSTIGVLIYACIFNRKQHSFRVKLPSTVTCYRCRYFNDNHFLQCALHPVTVLTEQSVDCMDYCQKARAKWFEDLEEYY
ncbi:hypothetical protein [Chamaesiphon sp.]|uniref:hypothetical protein n=1 Tax=Chamaesiphon sp. TaxID=2814140 RepID=UPI003593DF3C